MTEQNIYQDLSQRTGGACMLGVVGPVRTGKSTFIKRFMETRVIPGIQNEYLRQRAQDELPQSGSGRSIMTAEPKFVPEEPVSISLGENSRLSVRLVDCVGYMVEGAVGQMEDGKERLVTTPWFDHEVTMTEAAEKGTALVIQDHATIGIVVTTDGSVCDLPREAYRMPERRVISELKTIGKPFVVLLNSADPRGERAQELAARIAGEYDVSCMPVSCQAMSEGEIRQILQLALEEFPLRALEFYLPDWVSALPPEEELKQKIYAAIKASGEGIEKLRDFQLVQQRLQVSDLISSVSVCREEPGKGAAALRLLPPRELYYAMISERCGTAIENDGQLMAFMSEMREIRREYLQVHQALEEVKSTGYGIVLPESEELRLEEPQIVRQNGKYTVKLRAAAPAIHMIRTQIESEVTPAIGGDGASEEILGFLLQGFDGDINRIWESNIFGRSLNDLAEDSIIGRIQSLPENVKCRLRDTLERLINEGGSGLICILL